MTHKHRKKVHSFFLSAGCSLLRGEGFSYSLDICKLRFLIKKREKSVLFSFWSSKPWIRLGSGSGSEFNEFGSTALTILMENYVKFFSKVAEAF